MKNLMIILALATTVSAVGQSSTVANANTDRSNTQKGELYMSCAEECSLTSLYTVNNQNNSAVYKANGHKSTCDCSDCSTDVLYTHMGEVERILDSRMIASLNSVEMRLVNSHETNRQGTQRDFTVIDANYNRSNKY